MTITDRITLNLSGDNRLVRVQAKQGDIGSRFVVVDFEHDGVPYIVPAGVMARAEFYRPDRTHVLKDETVRDGAVVVELTQQMLTVAGEAACEVQLYENGTVLSSAVFAVTVNPSAAPTGTVESDPEYTSFKNALLQLETVNNDAAKSAAEAKSSAATAKGHEEAAKGYAAAAENSKDAVAASATAAETAKTDAEAAAAAAKADKEAAAASAKESADSAAAALESKEHVDEVAEHIDHVAGGEIVTKVNGKTPGSTGAVTVTATDVPTAAGKTVQQELDGLHTDVWDAFNVLADTPKNYATNRSCVIRPSFAGRTVQDGTPSPENPAPIKGVLNPWVAAYTGEPVEIDTRVPVNAAVEPLMRLPDGTCDQTVYRDGRWGVGRPIIKIILNGNSDWKYFSENNYTIDNYFVEFPDIVPNQGEVIYCDTLMPVRNNINAPNYSIHVGSGYHHASIGVHLPEEAVPRNDIQAMKAWANAHPITVYCRAATPTFEPIPAWDIYPYINPVDVKTTVTPVNPELPISPDNVATITGTPCITTAYTVAPMMALPDETEDQRAYKDGQWGIERNIAHLVLTVDLNWEHGINEGLNQITVHLTSPLPKDASGYYCTHAISQWPLYDPNVALNTVIANYGRTLYFSGSFWALQSVDAWKQFLTAQGPVQIWYPASTTTFEPIPTWNGYGKINPITATTTITKPNPDALISPDNIATITGTPVVTTGYRGAVKQLMAELFDGDAYDGVNWTNHMGKIDLTGGEYWRGNASGTDQWVFYTHLADAKTPEHNGIVPNMVCNRFGTVLGGNMLWLSDNVNAFTLDVGNSLSFKMVGFNDTNAWKAKLAEWAAAGQPLEVVYELATPIITRHNFDLHLSPGTWTVECGDDNGLLGSMSVEVLPDPATYGNRIYPYAHTKVGSVHQLTGTPGAAEISFEATAAYQDGDTWTINGAPVAATYVDGQELLPTAVIAGESVRAVLEREAVKHIDGVILPGENLLVNSDFRSAVNSIDQWYAVPTATLTPSAGCVILSDTNQNNDPSMTQSLTKLLKSGDALTIAILCERTNDPSYDMAFGIWTGQNWEVVTSGVFRAEKTKQTFVARCVLAHNVGAGAYFAIGCRGAGLKIYAVKLEIGPRFTGWNEPKFDALRLLMDKPTPQSSLIINGLFDTEHLVNQCGQNRYTPNLLGYTIDRWNVEAQGDLTVEILDYGIRITNTGTEYRQLRQAIDGGIKAGIYTTSAYIFECTGRVDLAVTKIQSPYTAWCYEVVKSGLNCFATKVGANSADAKVLFGLTGGSSVTVGAVKLEPGSHFTGWYDQKLGETRAECQRYMLAFRALNRIRAMLVLADRIDFFIPIPVSLRIMPTIAKNNMKVITVNTGSVIDGFTFSVFSLAENGTIITASKVAHGLSDAVLQIAANTTESTVLDANIY